MGWNGTLLSVQRLGTTRGEGWVGVCQRANKVTSSTTAAVIQCIPVPEPHVPLSRRLDFIKSSEKANFAKSAALVADAIARCEGKGL